jgi:hypothetical protein
MSLTLILLLIIGGVVLIGALIVFIVYSSRQATQRHMVLYDLVDGRMTELIALNKTAAELVGRAAERTEQGVRDQHEKEQSDLHRRIQTTEQANRFMTEQETGEPKEKR